MGNFRLAITAVLPLLLPAYSQTQALPILTMLHNFTGPSVDGANPESALAIGTTGVLYGVTYAGGTHNLGTVFQLTAQAGGHWTATILHSFAGASMDGSGPLGGLIIAKNGTLFGTTKYGGTVTSACSAGCGTVFTLTPPKAPGSAWAESVLYRFTGLNGDGSLPLGGVVMGQGGVLYGTTSSGGTAGKGTVFVLTPPAGHGPWTEAVIHTFAGPSSQDGAVPTSAVVVGAGGTLFGTTNYGGAAGYGTVFEMTPPAVAGGVWSESVLHSFTGKNGDGSVPFGSPTLGAGGVLYGTTNIGGNAGKGTVYQLTPPAASGGAWTLTVLHSFTANNGDGSGPFAGVVIGKNGALYGTTYGGGTSPIGGTIFEVAAPASGSGPWTETVLYNFLGPLNGYGSGPIGGLVVGPNGVLCGATQYGGTGGDGTVFELKF